MRPLHAPSASGRVYHKQCAAGRRCAASPHSGANLSRKGHACKTAADERLGSKVELHSPKEVHTDLQPHTQPESSARTSGQDPKVAAAVAMAAADGAKAELTAELLAREVARRRNFAIISHPDAGKRAWKGGGRNDGVVVSQVAAKPLINILAWMDQGQGVNSNPNPKPPPWLKLRQCRATASKRRGAGRRGIEWVRRAVRH
ncbi:hypothetical protein HaLaN_15006 [Haematococcus lacustris]|uniref:Peptide chain release factor 3 n=1 Tax=Haematococcus lacustris TaxID=44745 RepID=A0A699Z6I2_HAELA|nr:hypothetical protein HaLaN_15006 [Haematococcus lacustris]